ncbi:MAG TPA: HutD family protein [Rhodanobacteraceae bacterium]|nr:HutD family protein [Rhodanobacteraceae bacterium]
MQTVLQALPAASRRNQPWANGLGQTAVILREPDDRNWSLRISVAQVECDGPFSELPDTRRLLVPLDAAMELRFPDGRTQRANRFGVLRFAGEPAPFGVLPEGATRDFNLMLRGDARGELFARTLVDSMILPAESHTRWLVYLNRGDASLCAGGKALQLAPDDAALLSFPAGADRTVIEGAGELVLAKLYDGSRGSGIKHGES